MYVEISFLHVGKLEQQEEVTASLTRAAAALTAGAHTELRRLAPS